MASTCLRLPTSVPPFALAAALAAATLLSGCNKPPPRLTMPPPVVTVATVGPTELVEWEEFTGRTDAVEFVEVRARVSGHLQEIRFKSGQKVAKGDVLFVIDPRWHRAEADRRRAELQQARVHHENAEREAARTEQLLAKRAISVEEADARQARFREAAASLLAAEATFAGVQLDLEHTEVKAPISGRISREFVTVGNYVSGLAGGATPLTSIVSVDPVYAYADVDENSLLRFNALLKAGKLPLDSSGRIPVDLQLSDETSFSHHGAIESTDNRVDPKTGSMWLRAVFENPDGRIVPGLFARLRIPLSERYSAVLIDEQAVGTDQAQKFVLTLTATNTVDYRRVVLGPSVLGKRVVREGLKAGEKIVVNGLQRVRSGMPVQPELAATEAKPAAAASP